MKWTTIEFLLAFGPWFALAQSGSPTTSSSVTPTISISVGATGHHFTPENITANIGDIIEFRFYPVNHSVARAEFADPCVPSEYHEGKSGFWSGFHPLSVIPSNPPTFQIKINDTNPLFFYCSAPGACVDGMVGVINPNSTQSLALQKQYAKDAKVALSPGEPIPPEVVPTTTSSTTTVQTSTSAPTVPSPSATAPASSSSGLSTGAIAGIAIGGAFVLILAAVLVYLCGRQRTLGEIIQRQHQPSVPPPYIPGPGDHMSMVSPGFAPKMTYLDNDPLNVNRFSQQTGVYERSEIGTESYRSRSPPVDEHREAMIPPMNFGGNQRNYSPSRVNSPPIRRPVPNSPGMMNTMPNSPVTPMMPGQEDSMQYPNPLRVSRNKSQIGPHELPVGNDDSYR